MTNTYVVEKKNSIELLEHLDNFVDKMNNFIEKYPKYSYSLNIYKNLENSKNKWVVEAKVSNNEK